MKSVKLPSSKPSAKPRGRPRNPATRTDALDAATSLIAAGGFGAVTMEAVARLAKVTKPTLYRYWSNREDLAMSALMRAGAPKTDVQPTKSAIDDLSRQLHNVAQAFASPRGRNVALMVASADQDSELSKAFRNQVMLASREEGRTILSRAMAGDLIRTDADIDVVLDMIYGPVFYRLLIGHMPVTHEFLDSLLGEIMRGLIPPAR